MCGRFSRPVGVDTRIPIGRDKSTPIELFCDDQGAGTPVVLVPGWPLGGTSWRKQTAALMADGYRVVAYDRRGFGRSSKPMTGYDYDTLADDLHKVLTHLDLCDTALVGFSMGAGEVVRYLHAYGSRRVSCAVLIGSLPPFLPKTADDPAGLDAAVFDAIREALVSDRAGYLSTFFSDLCDVDALAADPVGTELIESSREVAATASPTAMLECVSAWLTDFRRELSTIDVPTLIVHGDADRLFPLAATALPLHAAVKDSELVVVEGGPHGVIWTHADHVNDALRRFLRRHGSSTPLRTRPTTRSPEE